MDDGGGYVAQSPPMSEPRAFRFARNFRWSLLGQAATAVASFLATPYLIRRFGLEAYGLYVILQSAVNYIVLANFGAGASAFRHIAAAKAENDGPRVRATLRWSLFFHGPTVLVTAALAVSLARPLLQRLFQVPPELLALGVRVMWGAAVGAVFFSLTTGATTAMSGLQRFGPANAVTFFQMGLMPLAAVALAWAGFGLDAIAWCYAVIQALGTGAAWLWLRAMLAETELGPENEGHMPFARFASWALSQWLGQLAWIVSYQLDRVFAAQHASLAGMTLYAVPVGLLQRLSVIPATFTSVALPMLSEMRETDEKLRLLYLRQFRLLLWLGLPGLVLLFSLMPQFLSLWLGGRFGDAAVWPARLQVIAQVFSLLTAMPSITVMSHGKPWMPPALTWSQAVISLLAWALLVPSWGLLGVGWGALLGQALPAVVFLHLFHRHVIRLRIGRFISEALFAPALSAGTMLAVVFPFHDRASNWTSLALFAAAGVSAYALSSWALLGAEDRALVRRYVTLQRR